MSVCECESRRDSRRTCQSVCLCPLTVFVSLRARCRKRRHLALESVFVLVCVLSTKCETVVPRVGTLEKTNVHLLLGADRGHKAVPWCNSLLWRKQDVLSGD